MHLRATVLGARGSQHDRGGSVCATIGGVITSPGLAVYLELGAKRVFAVALEWPGWSRSARDERRALEGLVAYGARYAAAVAGAGISIGFEPPADPSALTVAERLPGGSGTDFGAPSAIPAFDGPPLGQAEARRQAALLQACWATFDRIAGAAVGIRLAKGPRGGGRELDAIIRHVLEAEQAYLAALGGRHRAPPDTPLVEVMAGTRAAVVDTLMARVRGDQLPPTRRTSPLWPPRYFVRRSAWHVLDHAWEIEDRAIR